MVAAAAPAAAAAARAGGSGVKYRLDLSYRGTRFGGWQRQPNALSVQEVVERALAPLLGEPVVVCGASRTDAGVHARGQVAHITVGRSVPLGALVHGVNHRLPDAVRVLRARVVPDCFHARFSARSKEYRYRLSAAPVLSPLDAETTVRLRGRVDLAAIHAAGARLLGRHDFSAFANAGGASGSTERTVFAAEWLVEGELLTFRVNGDGFLRGMVRSLVGTMLELGRGRRNLLDLEALLAGGTRAAAGPTMPARGLELVSVAYPPELESL